MAAQYQRDILGLYTFHTMSQLHRANGVLGSAFISALQCINNLLCCCAAVFHFCTENTASSGNARLQRIEVRVWLSPDVRCRPDESTHVSPRSFTSN